ncbi:MAG: UbiA family prenyltransferase [Haloarculaceae archaeon]
MNQWPAHTTDAVLTGAEWIWKPLVYSSAYIAVIAALEVVMVLLLLDLPANPAPVIVGCVTFTIYVNDRIVDADVDVAATPGRTAFVRRHSRTLSGLAAVSYGLAVTLAVYGGPGVLGLTLFPFIVWVLYAVDWAPANAIPFKRLKELLIVNSTLVAVAWAATVVLLPVVYVGATITPAVAVLLVYFAIGTFIGAEIANVGDVEADRDGNVATLPSTVGVHTTRGILYGVGLAGMAILGLALAGGYFGIWAILSLAVGLTCMLGVVALLGRVDDPELLTIGGEFARLPVLVLLLVPGTIA